MSSQRRGPQQATLFELELDEVEEPTFEPEPPPLPPPARPAPGAAIHAPFRARLFAGLADLAAHVAMVALALLGARALGVPPTLEQAPAFAVLLLVLSLFYTVVPLAFWGKTPGMAAVGLVCAAGDELPLTFAEALRRWLGELVTVLALGLPGLLALGADRRSLADRWSGSDLVTQ
ncbi:MAG TPA: RDD family protein [Thermoanaerobaculia bacterium]|jgi:uncharacterized RDD family membrane protein YckC|nr:RDD family protein [Thermoanaerobaculia bacterium]